MALNLLNVEHCFQLLCSNHRLIIQLLLSSEIGAIEVGATDFLRFPLYSMHNGKVLGFHQNMISSTSNCSISKLMWSETMFLGAAVSISSMLNRLRTFLAP